MADDRWRGVAYGVVVSTFFLQGALVWSDAGPNPGSAQPISSLAREGQEIFRSRDCQACHAIFGMGGFLGPDLTNAASRVPDGRFAEVLTEGTGVMPAFRLTADERSAVRAYLRALDETGRGVPAGPTGERGPLFAAAFERYRGAVPEEVERGLRIVDARDCGGCHESFAAGGPLLAPDVSLAITRLGDEGVRRVLQHGRGAMPAQALAPDDLDRVVALLTWTARHRDELAPRSDGLPAWFAYAPRPSVARR